MTQNFEVELRQRIDETFKRHPRLPDHREMFPWVTGFLGDPSSPVWFVAENPSLGQVERASGLPALRSPESQWAAVSRGDLLFREMLVEHGFKVGDALEAGGWRCYITDVIKSVHRAEAWNREPAAVRWGVAEAWASVFAWELATGNPRSSFRSARRFTAFSMSSTQEG